MAENKELEMTIPELTLEPTPETQIEPAQTQEIDAPAAPLDESILSEAERKVVDEFAAKINIADNNMILQYGASAQKKMADFSESALSNVRTKDLGEVGNMLIDLIGELKGFDEDQKGIAGFFKRSSNKLTAMKAKYSKAETNVNNICKMLENHQVQLFKDIAMLDEMYKKNLINYKELSMYIIAGKKKLEEVRRTTLQEMIDKANQSGLPEDSQAANDMANFCNRFEKKLHDLELTRIVSIQMGPQIRLVQNNDTLMAEKIQSTLVNTIPLWKNQMVLALGLEHSNQAMRAQREVSNMTNELLRKNAETLKMGTIETAKESERGIVDVETLKNTNQKLIETLDEVIKIQNEGHQKRQAAEVELSKIEGQLKQKLLEINS